MIEKKLLILPAFMVLAGGALVFSAYADDMQILTITQNAQDLLSSRYIIGDVTGIENGKDGVQVSLNSGGIQYSTAVSVVTDQISGGTLSDIQTGSRLKVYYTDIDSGSNLLIGNYVEILSSDDDVSIQDIESLTQGLSSSDEVKEYEKQISDLKTNLDQHYIEIADAFIAKISAKLDKLSSGAKTSETDKIIAQLDTVISKILPDISSSQKMKNAYYTLRLVELELKSL